MNDKKILVVEDDLFLRDIYDETLRRAGYNVQTAKDGREGLERIKEGGWDLVLLDVLLPEITGIEIMQQLKDVVLPKLNKAVVFLTNMDNPEEIEAMHKLGLEYLIKSDLTPPELLEKIKPFLS